LSSAIAVATAAGDTLRTNFTFSSFPTRRLPRKKLGGLMPKSVSLMACAPVAVAVPSELRVASIFIALGFSVPAMASLPCVAAVKLVADALPLTMS
jgi:hypothetical protein